MNKLNPVFGAVLLIGAATAPVYANVSAAEAEQLKNTLTPMGSERAGNKEGTIPEWNGGDTTSAPGWKDGDIRPDKFSSEHPLFVITSANSSKYADKLTPGQLAMFDKYPEWKMEVYPTHRVAAEPQWNNDQTFKNATTVETTDGGYSFKGGHGGHPFPIPKTGAEAMWNHLTAWRGVSMAFDFWSPFQTSAGQNVIATLGRGYYQYPWNDPKDPNSRDYWDTIQQNLGPPYKKGEQLLVVDSTDGKRRAAQYLPGQRRVRVAPTVGYDTPSFILSGIANFDELFGFLGALDRYTWKLVGKKEVFIPYNENRMMASNPDVVMNKHFVNPDLARWELHRVWVVEANLREGARNVVAKRTLYLDEDTWYVMLGEGYDAQGRLWKVYQGVPFNAPDIPAVVQVGSVINNLIDGTYVIDVLLSKPMTILKEPRPASYFTPDSMASHGVE